MQTAPTTSGESLKGIDKLGTAILEALDEAPVSDVLTILTSSFVSLTLELVRLEGHDTNLPVKIDGGPNRDITIHAPKHVSPPDQEAGDATRSKSDSK